VEFDEFGNPFNRMQLDQAVGEASVVAKGGGDVVVYIHGWHHSAKPGDGDVVKFKEFIDRANSSGGSKVTVGLYLSWRGDSIEADTPLIGWTSYLFTFWDRKSTAHNIGAGGGVSETLRRLSSVRVGSPDSRLMVIGHSFGGAILYSSVSQSLGDQIRRDAVGNIGAPTTSVADLVVLVNPAFEAMRLKPLFDMARSYEYDYSTTPSLVIVTSSADVATNYAFPIGRRIGGFFQNYPTSYQRQLSATAVGQYYPMITHQLRVKKCMAERRQPIPLVALNVAPYKNYCIPESGGAPSLMWTRCESPGDCEGVIGQSYLKRGLVRDGYMPYRFPIANIRTDSSIMSGHNDIWNGRMSNFLYALLLSVRNSPEALPMTSDGLLK
jgi:hypothetical protein